MLACLLYPIQSHFKNYVQLCLNVYLCHVFNNTKIKAFLSYCCILCSKISEDWFVYLTSMQKSSSLSLCSGNNSEPNSPMSHIPTVWKNRDMYTMAIQYLLYPIVNNFESTQNNSVGKKKHVSIFKANALVLIKAKQVTFKIQKSIVGTFKIKIVFSSDTCTQSAQLTSLLCAKQYRN